MAPCRWRSPQRRLLTIVGVGGLIWVLPVLALVALGLWRSQGLKALLRRAWPLLLVVAILVLPALLAANTFSPTQGPLTSATELGNLIKPLSVLQYAGIWPNGDFRLDPNKMALTDFLIAWLCWPPLRGRGSPGGPGHGSCFCMSSG